MSSAMEDGSLPYPDARLRSRTNIRAPPTSARSTPFYRHSASERLPSPGGHTKNRSSSWRALTRRPKLLLVLVVFLCGVYFAWHYYRVEDWLVLARFKLRDRAYEEGSVACGLRKRPMVFLKGNSKVSVVWEMNCAEGISFRWGVVERQPEQQGWFRKRRKDEVKMWSDAKVKRVKMPDATSTHFVYTAQLARLQGGQSYAYSLHLPVSTLPIASHTFTFQSPTNSPISNPSKLTIGAVGDNQYNVRTFHRVLRQLLRTSSASPPDLLLHVGDVVQNPHNLAQWQTDFWDPFTSLLPHPDGSGGLGQSTPILLARGNHDWDDTGLNHYVGGSPPRSGWSSYLGKTSHKRRSPHRGTYFSYSPHERVRIVVLDSNLVEREEMDEQADWLEWECERREWRQASIRMVVVHIPSFLEYWDRKAWTVGKESEWGSYVRHRLTPLVARHGATIVLSGHQHAYSRGFLPLSLHPAYTSSINSSTLPASTLVSLAASSEASEPGVVYTTFGGAGGTLDEDLVEQWGFYEKSIKGVHHFVVMDFEFGVEKPVSTAKKSGLRKRLYTVRNGGSCDADKEVLDTLEWRALSEGGKVIDEFRMEAISCLDDAHSRALDAE